MSRYQEILNIMKGVYELTIQLENEKDRYRVIGLTAALSTPLVDRYNFSAKEKLCIRDIYEGTVKKLKDNSCDNFESAFYTQLTEYSQPVKALTKKELNIAKFKDSLPGMVLGAIIFSLILLGALLTAFGFIAAGIAILSFVGFGTLCFGLPELCARSYHEHRPTRVEILLRPATLHGVCTQLLASMKPAVVLTAADSSSGFAPPPPHMGSAPLNSSSENAMGSTNSNIDASFKSA